MDEAGDPTFYSKRGKLIVGTEGCSPILILGFIQTTNPEPIRNAVRMLQQTVVNDPYFQDRPSLKNTAVALHANADLPEIRYLFFKHIASLDFRAKLIVARKIERLFIEYDNRKQNAFYDHIVSCLFKDVLHLHEENYIYFAKRQSRARQAPLVAAIEKGRKQFEHFCGSPTPTTFLVQAQTPSHEPCLSVIDYVSWAVYQAYIRRDMRYFNTIRDKVSVVGDIYDREVSHHHWYDRKNLFDIAKTTPL